ncbi:hypothetical protein RIF29_37231 [Crotalaria pallida]|uniref:AAA+ ATPase domain-containing protein n=1 Tax=Crotalaria pallida TaxID=3830 RepID=A0AAN9EED7_CROPI
MFGSLKDIPSLTSSIFSAYTSLTAATMLLTMTSHFIPQPIRDHLSIAFRSFIKPRSNILTLVIEESTGITCNQLYSAAETYLSTKVSLSNERLKVSKIPKEKKLTIRLEKDEKLVDSFNGVSFNWRFSSCSESSSSSSDQINPNNNADIFIKSEKRFYELSFQKKHKQMALECYLPFILDKANEMRDEERVLKMHTLNTCSGFNWIRWDSINLQHPSTFETLAMDSKLKKEIMEDLNRFVKRKDFYKRVGRAWKRGYLLYGPPGTGKSSLIAAMANYLKFDIFDLQLGNVERDSDLRRVLLATANRSILVIEDIDCTVDLPDRFDNHGDGRKLLSKRNGDGRSKQSELQLTLSGLLNFIDGLWSSCGDERIIIFTTNHKERLDPALLRPGRMDKHIHMSYCSYEGFKVLASNYLEVSSDHHLFGEIEGLIEDTQITPAQVAEELMKDEDVEATLEGFVKLLKRKKIEGDVSENDTTTDNNNNKNNAEEGKKSKRRKVNCKQTRATGITKRNGAAGTQRRTRSFGR